MFNKIFPKNRAVYDVIWKTLVQLEKTTDDSTKRRMRTASWITKATDTNSEYAIFIASSTAILVLRTRLEYYIIHPCLSMGTGSLSPEVKRPGRGADHPTASKCRDHERVELYLYSPFGT